MCTQIFFLGFTVQPNKVVLILKFHYTYFLKNINIKKIEATPKNPQNYEGARNEISLYKQKPVKIDDFNDAEEK